MPGSEDRTPGDPNRPPVGQVGELLQEVVDETDDTHAAEEQAGPTIRPNPHEHPAPGAVEADSDAMDGEAPTG